jgi:hypothetical protein
LEGERLVGRAYYRDAWPIHFFFLGLCTGDVKLFFVLLLGEGQARFTVFGFQNPSEFGEDPWKSRKGPSGTPFFNRGSTNWRNTGVVLFLLEGGMLSEAVGVLRGC